MSEKVLHEVRIVETDEGFRIELKGDKEELRRMIFGRREWDFGPFGRHGHGPFGRHHHEHPHHPFEQPAPPPPEGQPDVMWFKRHGPFRGRRFGGRWEARWGYDLGPWWDESGAPNEEAHEGRKPHEEPPADL